MWNKDTIKNNLSIEQVFELVDELGGNPQMVSDKDIFIAETICHNEPGEGSHKLYYYGRSHLFHCYTECGDSFDIFELILKIKRRQLNRKVNLIEAIYFVGQYFGFQQEDDENAFIKELPDWKIFNKYNKELSQNLNDYSSSRLSTFDDKILFRLPQPHILNWEQEGISYEVIKQHNIRYDPVNEGVIIPHYDINGNLVGIRERTLIKENEIYGKYRPAILNYKMYNHPLGFNLYNLNNSKDNIKTMGKVIIFESEKATLQYNSFMPEGSDITCAVCGSSLTIHQVQLLMSLKPNEIIIGFDRQYQEIGDEEWRKWTDKLKAIHDKYGAYCQISFLFDKEHLLDYKDSPTDKGKDIFLELFQKRIFL